MKMVLTVNIALLSGGMCFYKEIGAIFLYLMYARTSGQITFEILFLRIVYCADFTVNFNCAVSCRILFNRIEIIRNVLITRNMPHEFFF